MHWVGIRRPLLLCVTGLEKWKLGMYTVKRQISNCLVWFAIFPHFRYSFYGGNYFWDGYFRGSLFSEECLYLECCWRWKSSSNFQHVNNSGQIGPHDVLTVLINQHILERFSLMTFFSWKGGLIKNEREPVLEGAEWRVHGTLKLLIKKIECEASRKWTSILTTISGSSPKWKGEILEKLCLGFLAKC